MTTDDIKCMQITLVTKDGIGKNYVTVTDDSVLIKMIVSMCKFIELNNAVIEEIPIDELIK